VSSAEFNFILAALRLLQREGLCDAENYPARHKDIIEEIMVPDPDHDEWLTAEQVNELCERLNCDYTKTT
jgi:hypothetical protein